MKVKIKLLSPQAALPEKATEGAAGYDIRVWPDGDVTLAPGEIASLPTGIAMEPVEGENTAALLLGRSGLGTKYGVTLANCVGLIDSDYRGEIRVSLINRGSQPFTVHPGDRVAQMLFVPLVPVTLTLAETLTETARAAGGFGSTGVG